MHAAHHRAAAGIRDQERFRDRVGNAIDNHGRCNRVIRCDLLCGLKHETTSEDRQAMQHDALEFSQ